jgi:hypothetical protein
MRASCVGLRSAFSSSLAISQLQYCNSVAELKHSFRSQVVRLVEQDASGEMVAFEEQDIIILLNGNMRRMNRQERTELRIPTKQLSELPQNKRSARAHSLVVHQNNS